MDHYKDFLSILKEELVPAQGCTEPIAIAFASARAREHLGAFPDKMVVYASGNIIKNVKSVVVPNSGGLTGIKACAILGAAGGDTSLGLRVLTNVTSEASELASKLEKTDFCRVEHLSTEKSLHIIVEEYSVNDIVRVELCDLHDNVVSVTRNGECIFSKQAEKDKYYGTMTSRDFLTFDKICDFAEQTMLGDFIPVLHEQIECNMAIAHEGMEGKYGLGIGKSVIAHYDDNVFTRMRALTAAASEARMCGCTLPVVTNSGSGNQGISASIPVVVFARENNIGEERLYRALLISNFITIYQKTFIGRLSAFCGAVSATCGGMCGVAYLMDAPREVIKNTAINTLASDIGVVCDGAKASCAVKISCGLDAARLALYLALDGKRYPGKCGLVWDDVDATIRNVGRMASKGMKTTDREILDIMLENS